MPMLDVSDILMDPDFMDHIAVIRSEVTVDPNTGRAYSAQKSVDTFGVVTSNEGQNLERSPDAALSKGSITIHTQFRLTEGGKGCGCDGGDVDADIVRWNGRNYTVVQVDDYSRYGAGFVAAVCSLYGHR